MSSRTTNYWKLGLFVLVCLLLGLWGLFWLGARQYNRPVLKRVTYFDESVQGLDVGAPVKMRGVTIGNVSDITIGEDRRLVKVTADVYKDVIARLGLLEAAETQGQPGVIPEDLRMQLATTGITGIKFLQVDFFPVATSAPPELGFDPPPGYVPSIPSTLKSMGELLNVFSNSVPAVIDRLELVMFQFQEKLDVLDMGEISDRAILALEQAEGSLAALDTEAINAAVTRIENGVGEVSTEFATLSSDLQHTLDNLRVTLDESRDFMSRLQAPEGPLERAVADWNSLASRTGDAADTIRANLDELDLGSTSSSIRSTSDSYRGLSGEVGRLSVEVQETLAALRETLGALQALSSYLERDPGALIRGRPASSGSLPQGK